MKGSCARKDARGPWHLLGLGIAMGATLAAPALADPLPSTQPPPPAPSQSATSSAEEWAAHWYGWQTLMVDGAGVLAGLGASHEIETAASEPPSTTGIVLATVYGVGSIGAPGVHFAHHRPGAALASMALRLTVPLLTSGVGATFDCLGREEFNHSCAQGGLTGGFLVGQVGASVFDALVLANDKEPSQADRVWYGWETATVDALGVAVGASLAVNPPGSKTGSTAALRFGLGWYLVSFLGAPIVHFAQGRPGIGFADLGLRLMTPVVGAAAGLMAYCAATDVSHCVPRGAEFGFIGGTALMAVVDATGFAWHDESHQSASVDDDPWMPLAAPLPGGAMVGVTRAF